MSIVYEQARDYPAHEKRESFTKELWQQDILTAITGLRLPFLIIENPLFQRLLQRAQSSSLPLEFPSAKNNTVPASRYSSGKTPMCTQEATRRGQNVYCTRLLDLSFSTSIYGYHWLLY